MPGLTSPCPVLWWGKPVLTCLPTPGGDAPWPLPISTCPLMGMSCSLGKPQGRGAQPHIHTASRAAADAQGRARTPVCSRLNLSGLSLQEAQQILNVSKLSPERIRRSKAPPAGLEISRPQVGRRWQAAS